MKTTFLHVNILLAATAAWLLTSGCVVRPDGRVVFRPVVVAPPPPVVVAPAPVPPPVVVEPAPAPVVEVPDDYVWDGYEYVGVVGGQYYYLGRGNVWLACEPFRLDRFHVWERGHPDWHLHAIRNDRYRTDHYGHVQPMRDERRRDEH